MKFWGFLPIIVLTFLSIVFVINLSGGEKKQNFFDQSADNRPIPKFSLPSIYEGYMGLNYNDFKGQYSLINIFASWCVSCRAEHPLLMEISKQGKVPLYGIAWKDDDSKTKKWLEKYGNPYKKIGADKTGDVVLDLGISGAPETFLINKNAEIIYHHVGVLDKQTYKNKILTVIQ